ncbi:MAG: hypothetical protein DWQ18_06045 [Crenarchaeota archaeon]|nr:MAG: hypothetical protein DWQ17_07090 [Thermoproteota archaeon]RDJ33599.1 MAG: hypothetical protein DWQ18_06045 [Thermoproteota archaeon]RDJ38078.1 MAG: hypothetical protein DWQ19_01130 [Thermoproteota archaeon]RDJ39152.1 MAG: hypothetical protein DWQ13_02540 [Thermoproteota archaeon]
MKTNFVLFLITAIALSGFMMMPSVSAAHHDAKLDSSIKLSVGETAEIKSKQLAITLDDISDSRCPKDVTCIWEGEVTATLSITKGDDKSSTIEIKTSETTSVEFSTYSLTLTNTEPYPEENMEIKKEQYVITLLVENMIKTPLDQFKSGISSKDIVCMDSLILLLKYDDSPACVSLETSTRLVERGWTLVESAIDSFEECTAAGNPVMESYPRQCRTDDGQTFVEEIPSRMASPEYQCNNFGGTWLEEFNECEYISSEQCSELNGEYFECESACRHDPDAQVCTMQCVPVCSVK